MPRYTEKMTVVNLNKFRKAKVRTARKAQADENAVKFGRSKAQKSLDEARAEQAKRELDGKERE